MKKKGKKKSQTEDAVVKWKELPNEERELYLSAFKPFVRKWLNLTETKKTAAEYSLSIALLFLSLLLTKGSLSLRLIGLCVFLADWVFFMFIEKCRKNGLDFVEGLIAIAYFSDSSRSSTSSTTER